VVVGYGGTESGSVSGEAGGILRFRKFFRTDWGRWRVLRGSYAGHVSMISQGGLENCSPPRATNPSSLPAARSCIPRDTCAYTSAVSARVLCPSRSLTTLRSLKAAKLPWMRIYDLRHSNASLLLAAGDLDSIRPSRDPVRCDRSAAG
jgi:hypothetical protein